MSVVLITGGSRGIGAGIARVLGRHGHKVFVGYKQEAVMAQTVANEIVNGGGIAQALEIDVCSEVSINAAMDFIREAGALDCVISNAAVDPGGDLFETSLSTWNDVIGTKLTGAFLLTKATVPMLSKSESAQLIYIVSAEGERPQPGYLAYGTATGGLITFAKAMAKYLPTHGVRANCIAPGTVRTDLWGTGKNDDVMWKSLADSNPMGRVPTPEDIGEGCRLLLEDPTNYLNGNVIYINGGNHL